MIYYLFLNRVSFFNLRFVVPFADGKCMGERGHIVGLAWIYGLGGALGRPSLDNMLLNPRSDPLNDAVQLIFILSFRLYF